VWFEVLRSRLNKTDAVKKKVQVFSVINVKRAMNIERKDKLIDVWLQVSISNLYLTTNKHPNNAVSIKRYSHRQAATDIVTLPRRHS
jgi:ribosomal protein L24